MTVSSVNAFLPDPGVIDYSAAKGALASLCRSSSKELGPDIRVNTISPGPVRTDLWLGDDGVAATGWPMAATRALRTSYAISHWILIPTRRPSVVSGRDCVTVVDRPPGGQCLLIQL